MKKMTKRSKIESYNNRTVAIHKENVYVYKYIKKNNNKHKIQTHKSQ